MSSVCLSLFVIIGAWALAHQSLRHLSEQTDLRRHHPSEAVLVQILGWAAEGTIRDDSIPMIEAVNIHIQWG